MVVAIEGLDVQSHSLSFIVSGGKEREDLGFEGIRS